MGVDKGALNELVECGGEKEQEKKRRVSVWRQWRCGGKSEATVNREGEEARVDLKKGCDKYRQACFVYLRLGLCSGRIRSGVEEEGRTGRKLQRSVTLNVSVCDQLQLLPLACTFCRAPISQLEQLPCSQI